MTPRALLAVFCGLVSVFACGGQSIREGDSDGRAGDADGDDGVGRGGVIGSGGSTSGRGGGAARGGTGAVVDPGGRGGAGGTSGTGGTLGTGGTPLPTGGVGAAPVGGASTGRGGGNTAGSGPVTPPGPVLCGGVECPAPRACCLSNGTCFDPGTEPDVCPRPDPEPGGIDGAPCASNAHCGSGQMCLLPPSYLCQGVGKCIAIASCPGSGYAVCACDGNSYPNVETACRAGANTTNFGGGACGDTVDLNQGEATPRWATLCGSDAHCAAGERCCRLTGLCYPENDPDRCRLPPEGTRYPCSADDQCAAEYEFCAGDGCGGPGGCFNLDGEDECGVRLEPVCGCDGVTYTSRACAYAEGVRVASEGECGE